MTDTEKNTGYSFPEFPENKMGVKRGDAIIANFDINYLGVKKGMMLPLGWDGDYIRCMGLTWGIEQIQKEINLGAWVLASDVIDFSKDTKGFIEKIEQRTAILIKPDAAKESKKTLK